MLVLSAISRVSHLSYGISRSSLTIPKSLLQTESLMILAATRIAVKVFNTLMKRSLTTTRRSCNFTMRCDLYNTKNPFIATFSPCHLPLTCLDWTQIDNRQISMDVCLFEVDRVDIGVVSASVLSTCFTIWMSLAEEIRPILIIKDKKCRNPLVVTGIWEQNDGADSASDQ